VGRARPEDSRGASSVGGSLIRSLRALSLVATILGCSTLAPDFDRVIAIQINGSLKRDLIVGDTIQLSASALNAAGDVVTDAVIVWALLDVDNGQLGFSLDETTGQIAALTSGGGDVQAQVENLRSEPIKITVSDPAPFTTALTSIRRSRSPINDPKRRDGPAPTEE
jgi:hypothetical protein